MMSGESAEYWARRWMKQGYGTMEFRHLEFLIRQEMDPMRRCLSCEEPGYPCILAWPERSHGGRASDGNKNRRRWGFCVYCGHKWVIYDRLKGVGGPPRAFTPEEERHIEELYVEAGWLAPDIAKMMHCHPGTIRNILKRRGHKLKHGGSKPFKHLSKEQFETMKFLRGQLGWTLQEVGEYMHMPPTSVGSYCRKLGIKRFTIKRIRKEVDVRRRENYERWKGNGVVNNGNGVVNNLNAANSTVFDITYSTVPVTMGGNHS